MACAYLSVAAESQRANFDYRCTTCNKATSSARITKTDVAKTPEAETLDGVCNWFDPVFNRD